jgi:hypothetical protein
MRVSIMTALIIFEFWARKKVGVFFERKPSIAT